MIPFPLSALVLPWAVILGVVYVRLARARWRAGAALGRALVLALTWTSPLLTSGPGPVQLILGLLVGFLGIRMVALGERWKFARLPPPAARVLVAMVTPEQLLVPIPLREVRPGFALVRGLFFIGACVTLIVIGNEIHLWRWSRFADDMLVFGEVAVGTAGLHHAFIGLAGLAGHSVAGLLDRPILSASFSEFWSRRWNHLVQGNLDRGFFRPYGRRRQWALGTLAAFTASGVMHVIAVLDPVRLGQTLAPSVAVMGFFLLHAALVLGERRLGWHRAPQNARALFWARARTVLLFALLSPLLLDPFASVAHLHGRSLGW